MLSLLLLLACGKDPVSLDCETRPIILVDFAGGAPTNERLVLVPSSPTGYSVRAMHLHTYASNPRVALYLWRDGSGSGEIIVDEIVKSTDTPFIDPGHELTVPRNTKLMWWARTSDARQTMSILVCDLS